MISKTQKTVRTTLLMMITAVLWLLMASIESLDVVCCLIMADIILVQVIAYNSKKAFNFYYIFISALALFHFGQIFTYIFDIEIVVTNAYDLFDMYSEKTLLTTLKFCVKGYNLIALFGYIFAYKDQELENTQQVADNENTDVIYNFGICAFWILLLPLLLYDITFLRMGLAYGYEAKYMYTNSLLASVDVYYPACVMCIMIAAPKESKAWKYYYIFIIVRMALQMFIVGNRGPLIINLIIYELIRNTYHSSEKKKKLKAFYVVIGLAVAVLISFIAVSRGEKEVNFSEFLTEYNFIALFLSEFGSTLITPILVVLYTGRFGFLAGKTYLGGLAALLPFSSQYMSEVRSYMNVGALMNPYSPNKGALGGSLFADMYINYGESAILISIIMGIIVGVVSSKIMNSASKTFSRCLIFYFLNSLLLYVRGSSQDIFLGLKRVFYLVIVYAIFEIFYNKRAKRRRL